MARPPMFGVHEKQRIVLSVLRGECSVAEAARRNRCSETSIAKWRDLFVQGGVGALEAGAQRGPSAREAQLERELEQVTLVESPGGVAPPGSHRTRREPLGSPGSCHPACGGAAVQWAKSRGCRRWTACSNSHARLSLPRSRLYFHIAQRTR